jgi:hypothetical protein
VAEERREGRRVEEARMHLGSLQSASAKARDKRRRRREREGERDARRSPPLSVCKTAAWNA